MDHVSWEMSQLRYEGLSKLDAILEIRKRAGDERSELQLRDAAKRKERKRSRA